MAERELAAELAGRAGHDGSVSRDEAHVRLRHVDLPKLAAAGFVTWDENDATVSAATHPALDDSPFERTLPRENDEGAHIAADTSNGRRRNAMTRLQSRDGPWEIADLAREIAACEADGEPSTDAVQEVLVTLHHVHLPKLQQAGLVEYDADEGNVYTPDHGARR